MRGFEYSKKSCRGSRITTSFQTKNCSAFCTANQSTKTNL